MRYLATPPNNLTPTNIGDYPLFLFKDREVFFFAYLLLNHKGTESLWQK